MIVVILAQMEKLSNVQMMQMDVEFGVSWEGKYIAATLFKILVCDVNPLFFGHFLPKVKISV